MSTFNRLFESPYRRAASVIHRRIRAGDSNVRHLTVALIALAPSKAHRAVARDLQRAVSTLDLGSALKMSATARRRKDLRAEKIISRRYRYLWICNAKVASRSIIAALRKGDPEAERVQGATLEDVYASHPQAEDYYSFAFIRNPYHRTYSFFAEKHLASTERKTELFVEPYYGVSDGMTFDAICDWLNTPYGSDVFADRHWLSQTPQLLLPNGRMPDFVGRYENVANDLNVVAQRLGMPMFDLPHLNMSVGAGRAMASMEIYHAQRESDLSSRNKRLIRQRYAADFELGGYPD